MSSPRSEKAVLDYLDRLLTEAPEAPPPPVPTLQHLLAKVEQQALPETPVITAEPVVPKVEPAKEAIAKLEAPVTVTPPPAPVIDPPPPVVKSAPRVEPQPAPVALANLREQLPERFQALIFRVGDLKLAVPLHLLGGIHRRSAHLNTLPGKPDWFIGLMTRNGRNIQVADTAQFVLGDRYTPEMSEDLGVVIELGDSLWGLACSEVITTRDVSAEEVRWTAPGSRRPWLGGVLKDELCALLNTGLLIECLQDDRTD